jgi:hypothetical protein
MYEQYRENEIAAQTRFHGHSVSTSGQATTISYGILHSMYFELGSSYGDVMVVLADTPDNKTNAMHLKSGDTVQLWCANIRYSLATPTLGGCHIVTGAGGETTPRLGDLENGAGATRNADEANTPPARNTLDPALPAFVRRAKDLEDECKGGIDPAKIDLACAERDKAFQLAEDKGWCFGEPSDGYAQRFWKKCNVKRHPLQ